MDDDATQFTQSEFHERRIAVYERSTGMKHKNVRDLSRETLLIWRSCYSIAFKANGKGTTS